jgi:hypothetical protein
MARKAAASANSASLTRAKVNKQDEFYTQLADVEQELKHYRDQLKGKVVLCNCDDPYESNFFKYFALAFNTLGLKRLIATSFMRSPMVGAHLPLLEMAGLKPEGREPYAIEINEVPDHKGRGATDLSDVEYLLKHDANSARPLKGDATYAAGDFRSDECVAYLKEADVIVTNPPFSLFREFITQLVDNGKKFVILGNQNSLTTKEVFALVQSGKVWLGNNNGDMAFRVPEHYPPRDTRFWIDDSGQRWRSFGTMCWLTNMDLPKRHEELPLFRSYNPEEYPSYDNFDAIEVSSYKDIPADWNGMMGVPLGFLTRHNPDQFDIVGITKTWFGIASKKYPTQVQVSKDGTETDVSKLNDGAALKVTSPPPGKTYYKVGGDMFIQTYPRILIRRRGAGA